MIDETNLEGSNLCNTRNVAEKKNNVHQKTASFEKQILRVGMGLAPRVAFFIMQCNETFT